MAVRVDLNVSSSRESFCAFAPYSIHATIEIEGRDIVTLHDSGVSITVAAEQPFLGGLRQALDSAGLAEVEFTPFEPQ